MNADIYRVSAATVYILRYPLAAAAITLCILLFRRSGNIGWLLLSVVYIDPFYLFVMRLIKGYRLLPYMTIRGPATIGGPANVTINFDFPVFLLFAVAGLYLLYRKGKQEVQVQDV
jgi:hypothetical protein